MTHVLAEKVLTDAPLTDVERATAIAFLADLSDKLEVLGPLFRLAANEALRLEQKLRGYQSHRTGPLGRLREAAMFAKPR